MSDVLNKHSMSPIAASATKWAFSGTNVAVSFGEPMPVNLADSSGLDGKYVADNTGMTSYCCVGSTISMSVIVSSGS